jgi:LAO/AO transport system kinase
MLQELLFRALNGDQLAISRLLTKIETMSDDGLEVLSELMRRGGKSHVIGVTGIPGSGKSTLISELINEYSKRGHKVGVILVDPSSPYSQGSFMGNRIRMQDKSLLDNVFIRSLGSRGHLGGLSAEAIMLIEALDGLGFDKILVESVGAGQIDTDIVECVHTTLVLTVPNTGDEIQALKAGIMEIGDIYIVNKADKPEADATYNFIRNSLELGEYYWKNNWKPRLIKISAIKGEGISELISLIEEHFEYILKNNEFNVKIKNRRKKMLELILRKKLFNKISDIINLNYDLLENYAENKINILNILNIIMQKIKLSL